MRNRESEHAVASRQSRWLMQLVVRRRLLLTGITHHIFTASDFHCFVAARWLYTGDEVYINEKYEVFITDRIKV